MTAKMWLRPFLLTAALATAAQTNLARADDVDCVSISRGKGGSVEVWHPILGRELLRQALLVSAREEFGLATRDEQLGESVGGAKTLALSPDVIMADKKVTMRVLQAGREKAVYDAQLDRDVTVRNVPAGMVRAEEMSRTTFVDVLKTCGLTPRAPKLDPTGTVDADAEKSLAQLEPLTQIAGLRVVHRQIRENGESPARLAALARGYANLWQTTAFVWGGSPKLMAARALIYGQRAVVRFPKSPEALDGRAYAEALVGIPMKATEDLDAAKALRNGAVGNGAAGNGAEESSVNQLVRLLAAENAGELIDAEADAKSDKALARFFAFLAIEHSAAKSAFVTLAQAALETTPDSLRIISAINNKSGPGLANWASAETGNAFSRRVGALDLLPGIPTDVAKLVKSLRGAQGMPGGRLRVAALLHKDGNADRDEPSWHVVARQIEDLSFMTVEQRAYHVAYGWGQDASDVLDESAHLVTGHRYASFLQVLRTRHDSDKQKYHDAIAKVEIDDPTLAMSKAFEIWQNVKGPLKTQASWSHLTGTADTAAFDQETIADAFDLGGFDMGGSRLQWLTNDLRTIAPNSPVTHACELYLDWKAAEPQAAKWLTEAGDHPALTRALAKGYERARDYDKAAEFYDRYLVVSPDYVGYKAKAECYLAAGKEDLWLATYIASLKVPAVGLEHAQANVAIANFLVAHKRAPEAMPYARDAASSGAAWALSCLTEVAEANNDFDTAEATVKENGEHYDDPDLWPLWCIRTGRGNWPAASAHLAAYEKSLDGRRDRESMVSRLTCMISLGRPEEAKALGADLMGRTADPFAGLIALAFAVDQHDDATRDRMVALFDKPPKAFRMPDGDTRPALQKTGKYLGVCIREGKTPEIEALEKIAEADKRDEANVFYFAGKYALSTGDKAMAKTLLERAATKESRKNARSFAAAELRGLGG